MDAPNAPNPANPNTQDQFVDAVQGPANQAQGPAVQNQAWSPAVQNPAQGPTNQNQAQVPAGQIPAQGPAVPNSSSRSCSNWSKCTCPTTTTSASTTGPYWYCSACSLDNLSKLYRKET